MASLQVSGVHKSDCGCEGEYAHSMLFHSFKSNNIPMMSSISWSFIKWLVDGASLLAPVTGYSVRRTFFSMAPMIPFFSLWYLLKPYFPFNKNWTPFQTPSSLRILSLQVSYKDKFRKVVSWFSLRQDVSETLLKSRVHRSIFWKKMVRKSLKNARALTVERNYGSIYRGYFLFRGWPNKLFLFINFILVNLPRVNLCRRKKRMGHREITEESVGFSLHLVQIFPNKRFRLISKLLNQHKNTMIWLKMLK